MVWIQNKLDRQCISSINWCVISSHSLICMVQSSYARLNWNINRYFFQKKWRSNLKIFSTIVSIHLKTIQPRNSSGLLSSKKTIYCLIKIILSFSCFILVFTVNIMTILIFASFIIPVKNN